MPIVNHPVTIHLIFHKPFLALGPRWAVLAATLAVGKIQLEANFWQINATWLIKVLLFWILVDPILGTLWHLIVNQKMWSWLNEGTTSKKLIPKAILPYVSKNSMGYQLSTIVAFLQTQKDGRWQTLLLLTIIAFGLAFVLGHLLILYVFIFGISLLFTTKKETVFNTTMGQLWQSIITFLLPYLIGLILIGNFEQNAFLLGLSYSLVYFGSLRLLNGHLTGERLVIVGQAAIVSLLFALTKPLAAIVVALGITFILLIRLQAMKQKPINIHWYVTQAQPFLLTGLLVSAGLLGRAG